MHLVDTHCHIHDSEFTDRQNSTPEQQILAAKESGVDTLICVGTSVKSSKQSVAFADSHTGCYSSIALHPHVAEGLSETECLSAMSELDNLQSNKIVAIGECGLDYFYHSEKSILDSQKFMLTQHLELAVKRDLPIIFHVRGSKTESNNNAFQDFFELLDEYPGVRGVVHSFSATKHELQGCLDRNLYIGLNGIMTFTTDQEQLEAAQMVPLNRLLLETDAPYLTPSPFRGSINEPKHVILITQFLSELRHESQALLAKQTTKNAKKLFQL